MKQLYVLFLSAVVALSIPARHAICDTILVQSAESNSAFELDKQEMIEIINKQKNKMRQKNERVLPPKSMANFYDNDRTGNVTHKDEVKRRRKVPSESLRIEAGSKDDWLER